MRVPYEKAKSFAADHGAFCVLTLDGLLVRRDNVNVEFVGDMVFEEISVFDLDDDGNVDSVALRHFIGY